MGEYAANGDRKPNLRAGLAEAAFLLGFEHNADKVKASSFAPLLTHIDSSATQWDYDLLVFNATNIFALPSYDVQCMLNNASHGYTVPLNVTGKGGQVFRAGEQRLWQGARHCLWVQSQRRPPYTSHLVPNDLVVHRAPTVASVDPDAHVLYIKVKPQWQQRWPAVVVPPLLFL